MSRYQGIFQKGPVENWDQGSVFPDLRQCFVSQLVMAGVDLTTIKEPLGHKSLAMTLRFPIGTES